MLHDKEAIKLPVDSLQAVGTVPLLPDLAHLATGAVVKMAGRKLDMAREMFAAKAATRMDEVEGRRGEVLFTCLLQDSPRIAVKWDHGKRWIMVLEQPSHIEPVTSSTIHGECSICGKRAQLLVCATCLVRADLNKIEYSPVCAECLLAGRCHPGEAGAPRCDICEGAHFIVGEPHVMSHQTMSENADVYAEYLWRYAVPEETRDKIERCGAKRLFLEESMTYARGGTVYASNGLSLAGGEKADLHMDSGSNEWAFCDLAWERFWALQREMRHA